ncbi:hypothetical protein MKX01_006554 [Papaver californicum]|nr:hypothetical protein MKX01_006554 [Papaver californicum]
MNYREEKFVKFQDWSLERSLSSERHFSTRGDSGKFTKTVSSITERIWRGLSRGSEGNTSGNLFNTESKRKILDPQGSCLQKWNKIFVLSCVLAVYLDPLFFYISVIDGQKKCLDLDKKLQITACVLRSFTGIFYVLHIIFQFCTGFIAPSSRVFGRGVLVKDPISIARRYLRSSFLVDILAVLPLPQVVILCIVPKLHGSASLNTKDLLRFIRIYPLYKEVTRTSGIITEMAWVGAAFNLFLYMLFSHVTSWYLHSIERQDRCWRDACGNNQTCNPLSLYCWGTSLVVADKTFLKDSCPLNESAPFNFGIYLDALKSGVVESSDFPSKLFYCLWWGLGSLSSLGQNLETSTFVGEIRFAVSISIFGLVLFSLLIGNMQTHLQSNIVRLEEMRMKCRDAEQWMFHRLLPDPLKRAQRLRRYEQYRWQETRGVDEQNLICNLPKDLRRDIKRHLCLNLLMRVPMFEKMDEKLLDAMCDHLKPALYTEDSYIVREGDPVGEMLFIMRGKLLSVTTNGGRTGFLNSDNLKEGDFCGEELLTWASDPNSNNNLPIFTRTVQALTEVEGFALMADHLKSVASQFRRLHSKQLRHTFRFYSQQWRTWAACFIQAAWRRYSKKKAVESLRKEEDRLQDALAKGCSTSPSLGATIYSSRFAANALRAIRHHGSRKTRLQERLPPMILQKPAEPDFSAEAH